MPTPTAFEALRRMEPKRWYYDTDLRLPKGFRRDTQQTLIKAGYLQASHISWLTQENETRTYTIIRKIQTPDQPVVPRQDHLTIEELVEKYGKERLIAMITAESWKVPEYARSTVPPITGQLAGNCFDHLLDETTNFDNEPECPQPQKTSAAG